MALLCLMMLIAASARPADCNVSRNLVGYVRVLLPPSPVRSLIANPLNGTDNHLGTILPLPAAADGAMIYRWNAAVQAYGSPIIFLSGLGWHSDDPNPSWLILNPGEGFFIQNPLPSPLNVTFVGEVPEGSLVTPIPLGVSFLSSKVPQARPLGESGEVGTLLFPASEGDTAFLWNMTSQGFDTYSFLAGIGWHPANPVIEVGQGFGIQSGTFVPRNWTRTFVVSCASGPRLGIALRPGGDVQVTWSASGWKLQEAVDPEGPWTAVAGDPVSPYVTQPVAARKFFRLSSPCLLMDCPTNQMLPCAGPSGTPAVFTVTATNICAGTNVPVTCDPPSGSSLPPGASTVTCTASIQGGESSRCAFTITVVDTTPPMLSITRESAMVWICWPQTCADYVLQVAPHLNGPVPWQNATNQLSSTNGNWCIWENSLSETRFYQLRKR